MDFSYGGVVDSSDGGVLDSSYGGFMAPLYGLGDLTDNSTNFRTEGQGVPVSEGQQEELEQSNRAAEHLSPARGTPIHESYRCVDVPVRILAFLWSILGLRWYFLIHFLMDRNHGAVQNQ